MPVAGRGGGGGRPGYSKGGYWMTQLLSEEPQTAAAAVFLAGYPFPDCASLSTANATSWAYGKMPQIEQDCLFL